MEGVPSRLVCCSAEKGLFILGSASSLCSPEVLKKRLASIPMMPSKLGAQKLPAGPGCSWNCLRSVVRQSQAQKPCAVAVDVGGFKLFGSVLYQLCYAVPL